LICSIAGKANLQWVAAGDTAQMISPGCSFSFDGMKQTLREIQSGSIVLRKVQQLRRNYRMTKGVLEVGNAILRVLKKNFPQAIEYAQPEIAMKDLGLDVKLVDWDAAFRQKVSFGTQQALIYSTGTGRNCQVGTVDTGDRQELIGPVGVLSRIKTWLGDHPFVLTSLDSKGLEFDDVVVVFDFAHKAWTVARQMIESLRLLRELYVSITRARGRVVILVKNKFPAMLKFFESLECNIDTDLSRNIDVLPLEFEMKTTPKMWFERGSALFQDEQYRLAASCFKSANHFGWANRATGLHLILSTGPSSVAAKEMLRTAAKIFFESDDFHHCLDVFKNVRTIPPWEEIDNGILDQALEKLPNYLPRRETIEFALVRNRWNVISTDDLKSEATASLFVGQQYNDHLKTLLSGCSEEDLRVIETTLPKITGYWYLEKGMHAEAMNIFIRSQDEESIDRVIALSGQNSQVKHILGTAAAFYFESSKFERCLDVMRKIRATPPWEASDSKILDDALLKRPNYLPRRETVEFALIRDSWKVITLDDLKSRGLANLFVKHRSSNQLTDLVRGCSEKDRNVIAITLPNVVGDYYVVEKKYAEAAKLFRRGKDTTSAAKAEQLRSEQEARASKSSMEPKRKLPAQQPQISKPPMETKRRSPVEKPKAATGSALSGSALYAVGDRVTIVGLANLMALHLNGKLGRVSTPIKDGRYGVMVDGDDKIKGVKPDNLRKIAEKSILTSANDLSGTPDLLARSPQQAGDSSASEDDSSNHEASDGESLPGLLERNNDGSDSDDDSDDMPVLLPQQESSSEDDDSLPELHPFNASNGDQGSSSDSDNSMPELTPRSDDSAPTNARRNNQTSRSRRGRR
jgi:hypothetical protein